MLELTKELDGNEVVILTYEQIKQEINELLKKQIIQEVKQPDINASFHKEYYKNGNVKTYESTIRLKYPRTIVLVKNRDFEKYSASFHETICYFKLIFMTNFYEKRVKQYYLLMGRTHKKPVLIAPFETLLSSSYHIEAGQPYTPKSYVQSHIEKPSRYDRKYQLNEHIKTNKKMKEAIEKKQQMFDQDLAEYQDKIEKQQIRKQNFYDLEFPNISKNRNIINQIMRIKTKYTAYQKGYLLMNNEKQIERYLSFMMKDNTMIHPSYHHLKTSFFVDLDSKAIVLSIEIPARHFYPNIASLVIVRKRLTCKASMIDQAWKDKALNSYILSMIRMMYEADNNNKFDTLYINIYRQDNNCYGLLKISLNAYHKQFKKNIDPTVFLASLNGKRISYESIQNTVLPLQKGGI